MGAFDAVPNVGAFFEGSGFVMGAILLIVLGIVAAGIVGFFVYTKMLNKKQFYITVNLFKMVNGKRFYVRGDKAQEVVIPGTNVKLLRWKGMQIYSSYPTRAMGNNIYAYNINRFGELTNFDFGEGEDETEAQMDFDHRDQTYAYLNLQQLINRNWRKKETLTWWKEHLPLIVVIISSLLLILAMWFFFSQSAHQLATWTQISENFAEAAQCTPSNLNSGITPAT